MVVKTKAGVLRGLWLWSLRLSDVLTKVRVSLVDHITPSIARHASYQLRFAKNNKARVHSISKADHKTRQRTSTDNWCNPVDPSSH